MERKIRHFSEGAMSYREIMGRFQGWQAYAKWAHTFGLRKKVARRIYAIKKTQPKQVSLVRYLV